MLHAVKHQASACGPGNGAGKLPAASGKQHLHAKATPLAPPVLGLALPLLLDKVVQGHIDAPWHLLQGGRRAEVEQGVPAGLRSSA